jgi:23S rRNA pseudouridine2457 synthase
MHRYLKFFKPYEVLCQFTDGVGRPTLKEYVSVPNVYAAGRLDFRSEGLLLLTNDGLLTQRLTDPRFEHPKTYDAQVEGILTDEAIKALNNEIILPGVQTRLAQAERMTEPRLPVRPVPVRDYHPTSWLKITLYEGKKHQVRRMTAAVGFPCLRLVRVAIGVIALGKLQPGEWRELDPGEIKHLLKSLQLK